jgi:hypothetical protein
MIGLPPPLNNPVVGSRLNMLMLAGVEGGLELVEN